MQYTVQAAARATGVSESRLRTWERRYGVPSPGRSATGRRLYEESDLAVIRRMAALVQAGVAAAQAAQAVATERAGAIDLPQAEPSAEHPLVPRVVEAAAAFDEAAAVELIREAATALGWSRAVDEVVFPGMVGVGLAWQRGDISITNEHFVSELVRRELLATLAAVPAAEEGRGLTLIACPEDERHDLGAAALWLALRQRRLPVLYLGADVPPGELVVAARLVEPAAICLVATAPTSVPAAVVAGRALISARQPAQLFVGGPALRFEGAEELPGVRLPISVEAAAEVVADAIAALRKRATPEQAGGSA